ncbi:acyltransferase [Devosia pacifica]|uniref:Acyltransferase n=1 Tax=Devosia pacifica TaxID=1335967 RepID=A0A918SFV8_9HYPH|nr:acyltransferase [Devosia pacifica]GHA38863.1 acyltransferase [Devosia pacifica]
MTRRFGSIQYLRGLAAALVVASHAFLYPLIDEPMLYGRWGWLGVILFFVISGFIMVVVTGEEAFEGWLFLRRRAVRVIPMYWAATLFTAGLSLLAPQLFKSMTFDWSQLWRSLLFIPFYNETSGGIHPIYKLGWTLNYEVYFYLCFALLCFLRSIPRVVILTIWFSGLALSGLVGRPEGDLAIFYTGYMPLAFCAGMVLGVMANRKTTSAPPVALWGAGLVALGGLVLGMLWPSTVVEDWAAFLCALAFASCTVFLAIELNERIRPIRLLEQIGDASYSTYLSHIYVIGALSAVAYASFGYSGMYLPIAVLGIGCATLAGWLLHIGIERPLMKWLAPLAAKTSSPAALERV